MIVTKPHQSRSCVLIQTNADEAAGDVELLVQRESDRLAGSGLRAAVLDELRETITALETIPG